MSMNNLGLCYICVYIYIYHMYIYIYIHINDLFCIFCNLCASKTTLTSLVLQGPGMFQKPTCHGRGTWLVSMGKSSGKLGCSYGKWEKPMENPMENHVVKNNLGYNLGYNLGWSDFWEWTSTSGVELSPKGSRDFAETSHEIHPKTAKASYENHLPSRFVSGHWIGWARVQTFSSRFKSQTGVL